MDFYLTFIIVFLAFIGYVVSKIYILIEKNHERMMSELYCIRSIVNEHRVSVNQALGTVEVQETVAPKRAKTDTQRKTASEKTKAWRANEKRKEAMSLAPIHGATRIQKVIPVNAATLIKKLVLEDKV